MNWREGLDGGDSNRSRLKHIYEMKETEEENREGTDFWTTYIYIKKNKDRQK